MTRMWAPYTRRTYSSYPGAGTGTRPTSSSTPPGGNRYLLPLVRDTVTSSETREGWSLLLLKRLHHFSKIKDQKKKSQYRRNQGFSYFFCLMKEGSESIPLTGGSRSRSGSRRPKNIRIRIRRDFYPAMDALVSTVQNIFPHRKLFLVVSLYRPATGADSRAGSPVS